jgi:hypothetical protein
MNIRIPALFVLLFITISHSDSLNTFTPLKHSLQLQINDFIDISSFLNTIICYKYHFNSKESIRMGINLSGNIANSRDTSTGYLTRSVESDRKAASFEFSCNYIRYPYNRSNLFLYYGFGPSFSTSYSSSDNTSVLDTSSFPSLNNSTTYRVGIKGLFGIEWFLNKRFSLLTEYNLSSYYIRQEMYSKTSTDENKQILDGFSIQSSKVVLGISIYL